MMNFSTPQAGGGLRRRVTVLVLGLTSLLLCCAALVWSYGTKQSIREEVAAASRVAGQWLAMFSQNATHIAPATLIGQLQAVGRLRANVLEIRTAQGELTYRSPPSPYKAGRDAPAWFAAWFSPELPPQQLHIGTWQIRLVPDASRAVLDAWDALIWSLGWASLLLLVLGLGLRFALGKTLAPLSALEAEQYFAACLNQRLENERQQLARELHDELGQGITAVQAIAGAIAQRSRQVSSQRNDDDGYGEDQGDNASCKHVTIGQFHGSAQAILAMTAQMQQGVRGILQRLREPNQLPALHQRVQQQCHDWQSLHPSIAIHTQLDPCPAELPPAYQHCVLRLLQESLTNVARHAAATQVTVGLRNTPSSLQLQIADNGQGYRPATLHRGFGLRGMQERVAEWQGELHLHNGLSGLSGLSHFQHLGQGCCVTAQLPWPVMPAATARPSDPTAFSLWGKAACPIRN